MAYPDTILNQMEFGNIDKSCLFNFLMLISTKLVSKTIGSSIAPLRITTGLRFIGGICQIHRYDDLIIEKFKIQYHVSFWDKNIQFLATEITV